MQTIGHLAIAVHKSDHTKSADKGQEKYFFVSRHSQFEMAQGNNVLWILKFIPQYRIPLAFGITSSH